MKIQVDGMEKKVATVEETEKDEVKEEEKPLVRCCHCRLSEMKQKERMDLLAWRVNIAFGLACVTFMGVGVLIAFAVIQRSDIVELQDKTNGCPPRFKDTHGPDYTLEGSQELHSESDNDFSETEEERDSMSSPASLEIGPGGGEDRGIWNSNLDDTFSLWDEDIDSDDSDDTRHTRSRRDTSGIAPIQKGLKVQHMKPTLYSFPLRRNDHRLRNWTNESWSTGNCAYRPNDGTLTINETAIYLIYMQLTFLTKTTDNTYGLYRVRKTGRDELLRACAQGARPAFSTGDDEQEQLDEATLHTCNMVSTLQLDSGDRLYIKHAAGGRSTTLQLSKTQTFWGLVQLTSEEQRANPDIPGAPIPNGAYFLRQQAENPDGAHLHSGEDDDDDDESVTPEENSRDIRRLRRHVRRLRRKIERDTPGTRN